MTNHSTYWLALILSLGGLIDIGGISLLASESFPVLWKGLSLTGEEEVPPAYTTEICHGLDSRKLGAWELTITSIGVVPMVAPHPPRLFLTQPQGRVETWLQEEPTERQLLLAFPDTVKIELYSLTFDPQYPARPYLYLCYNEAHPGGQFFKRRNVIARWTVSQIEPPRAEAASALLIASWETAGHNGGDLKFGPDGHLWFSSGDGQDPGDPKHLGQTTDDWLGIIGRIDVREATTERPYTIPQDNPYRETPGVTPETWCYGLRNPWKMDFHPQSGELFVGDNGEDLWETVWRADKGANGGWSRWEGNHIYRAHVELQGPAKTLMPPVVTHPHTEMRSIIGGVFYRGKKHPELTGHYIYGDYCTGTVWGFAWKDGQASAPRLLANTSQSIVDFAEDHNQEPIFAVREGKIYYLIAQSDRTPTRTLAKKLSDTGLFSSTADLTPATGTWPYSIITPSWQDGAKTTTFMALPAHTQLKPDSGAEQADNFELPDGAALVQTITHHDRRLETRVIHRRDAENWAFYSYAWNQAQNDAELVGPEGSTRIIPTTQDGKNDRSWHFPSRLECMACHTWPGKRVIGLNPAQLNRPAPDTNKNQLQLWTEKKLFETPLKKIGSGAPALVATTDESAPLEARVRSTLHANCAHCHRSGGGGGGKPEFQLPWWFATEQTGMINADPLTPLYNLADAKLISPGSPEKSMIYRRVLSLGPGHMPLLGSTTVDESFVLLLKQWIESTSSLPAK